MLHYTKSTFYTRLPRCYRRNYKPLKGHILVFLIHTPVSHLFHPSCHFLPLVSWLFLFAPSSVIFLCLPAKHARPHWEWPIPQAPVLLGHPLNCLLMGVFLAILIFDTCSKGLIIGVKPGVHLQQKPWSPNLGGNGTTVSLLSPVTARFPLSDHLLEESNHLHFESSLMRCF